ncbi:hypothetical protein QFC21_004944 [Naganishia friedmannii]|uniref:Uncharacterized protein n=1 Tax=Naganishia friedmannii TaxID=89922 RepID=A0ACC2VEB3_9TREE|nr:hypothetical protein QFC21_004944 [Naganishia friedmannii]
MLHIYQQRITTLEEERIISDATRNEEYERLSGELEEVYSRTQNLEAELKLAKGKDEELRVVKAELTTARQTSDEMKQADVRQREQLLSAIGEKEAGEQKLSGLELKLKEAQKMVAELQHQIRRVHEEKRIVKEIASQTSSLFEQERQAWNKTNSDQQIQLKLGGEEKGRLQETVSRSQRDLEVLRKSTAGQQRQLHSTKEEKKERLDNANNMTQQPQIQLELEGKERLEGELHETVSRHRQALEEKGNTIANLNHQLRLVLAQKATLERDQSPKLFVPAGETSAHSTIPRRQPELTQIVSPQWTTHRRVIESTHHHVAPAMDSKESRLGKKLAQKSIQTRKFENDGANSEVPVSIPMPLKLRAAQRRVRRTLSTAASRYIVLTPLCLKHQKIHFTREIHSRILGFLAAVHTYGSLASYNVVDRSLHEITLETLYETMVLDSESEPTFSFCNRDAESGVSGLLPGFKYTHGSKRQKVQGRLPEIMCGFDLGDDSLRLSVKPDSEIRRKPLRSLQVIDSTDASSFHHILGTLRLRYLMGDDIARLQTVDSIADIRLKWGGYFTHADFL